MWITHWLKKNQNKTKKSFKAIEAISEYIWPKKPQTFPKRYNLAYPQWTILVQEQIHKMEEKNGDNDSSV